MLRKEVNCQHSWNVAFEVSLYFVNTVSSSRSTRKHKWHWLVSDRNHVPVRFEIIYSLEAVTRLNVKPHKGIFGIFGHRLQERHNVRFKVRRDGTDNFMSNAVYLNGLQLEPLFDHSQVRVIFGSEYDAQAIIPDASPVFVDVGLVRDDQFRRIDCQFADDALGHQAEA
jgi:hypothetical protein